MAGRKRGKGSIGSRLGENIASRRTSLGWTQADLAERIGVNTETVSRFERGAHLPALTTLDEIAGALRVSVSELLADQRVELSDKAAKVAA
jgi:transcriptional regulator with XRE-family HTH domain